MRTRSESFEVDVVALKQPAGKPRHVQERFEACKSKSHIGKLLMGQARREAFLAQRRSKLACRSLAARRKLTAHLANESAKNRTRVQLLFENISSAEQKRGQAIHEKVVSCAKSVAHAKSVAQTQSLKMEQERQALKDALEARLAETAQRRLQLLRVPRSRYLEDPLSWANREKDAVQLEAAVCLQIWWRRSRLVPAVRIYNKVGLTTQKAKSLPFERLLKVIQSESVIRASGRLLLRAKRLSYEPITTWKNPSRVFLSSFMILAHPLETLQGANGPQEQALKTLAQDMLSHFESWINGVKTEQFVQLGRSFLTLFIAYHDAFEAWKMKDQMKIVDELISHWIDVEKLWLSVRHQEDADAEWAPRIHEQQTLIRSKIAKFGPAALEKLEAARQQHQEQVGETDTSAARPSTPDASSRGRNPHKRTASSPQVYEAAVRMKRSDSVNHSRHSSVSSSQGSPKLSSKSNLSVATENKIEDKNEPSIPISPPGNAPALDTVIPEYGQMFSNEHLAHELVMDPDFALKAPVKTPMEEQMAKIAKRAFGDLMREQMQAGNYSKTVLGAISDIRQDLLSMISEKGKLAASIQEGLDLDLIEHQMTNSVFDLDKCLSYIGQMMSMMCAPVRDASIRALAQESDKATVILSMLDILQDMKLDLANYRLQTIKPHLKQQAVEYEKTKFDKALAEGKTSLVKTRAWLKGSVEALAEVVRQRNPENIDHPDLRVRYEDTFNHALLSLVFSQEPINVSSVPETLSLDHERLFGFQNEGQAIAIAASLIMLSKNIVPALRHDKEASKVMKDKIFQLLQEQQTNIETLAQHVIETLNDVLSFSWRRMHNLSQMTSKKDTSSLDTPDKLTEEQETLIKNMVEKTISYKDPIYSLLLRRVQNMIRQHLEREVFNKSSLAAHGLDSVELELQQLSVRIVTLAKHNKQVYSSHYDDILRDTIV